MTHSATARFSTIAAACMLCLGMGMGVARADIVYGFGNIQYDNVNIDADVLVHPGPLTAYINNAAHTPFYFANPHDAAGNPIYYIHGSHGDAQVQAWDQTSALVPFYSMEMYIEPGWGIDAMDFKLDAWNSASQDPVARGMVTFTAYDIFGSVMGLCSGTNTFQLAQGQTEFVVSTCGGELLWKLVMDVSTSSGGLSDIKQVSVNARAVPEPTTLGLLGFGLVGLGFARRRRTN